LTIGSEEVIDINFKLSYELTCALMYISIALII